MTERLHFHFSLSCIGEGNGNPLQCSCLENPRDGEAWRAAVYGVTQSWTRLKRLSSSSSGGSSSSPKSLSEFLLIQQPAPLVLGIFFSLKTQEQVKTSKNGFSTHCVEQRIIRKNTYCFFYDLKKKVSE